MTGKARWIVAAVLVAAVVGGLVGAVVVLALGGTTLGGTTTKPPSTPRVAAGTSTTVPALQGPAKKLLDLLHGSDALIVHAVYTVTSTDPAAQGQSLQLELWRHPPQLRQDTIAGSSIGSTHTASFQLDAGPFNCTEHGTGPWSCTAAPQGAQSGPDAIVNQVAAQLASSVVAEDTEPVNGQPTDCFTVSQGTTVIKMCEAADGLPIKVTDGSDTLMLVSRDGHVPNAEFTLPAKITAS